jgi:hypothetical protein
VVIISVVGGAPVNRIAIASKARARHPGAYSAAKWAKRLEVDQICMIAALIGVPMLCGPAPVLEASGARTSCSPSRPTGISSAYRDLSASIRAKIMRVTSSDLSVQLC